MKDWKEKLLSQAGKEVLIKAVIQAIPSYSMNCFLFPITTCQEIERATSRFFWGSTVEDRKQHWAGWDILTTSKAQGGIGFKELHFFNIAMLAKQVWTLIQNPESLAFRLLKAKYFPQHDMLQAETGNQPCYLWRSLMAAMDLVREGKAWRIGDGNTVGVNDRWIGVEEQRRPEGGLQGGFAEARVSTLIDPHSRTWREELITTHFQPHEVQRIMSIPLGLNNSTDRRIWRCTPHGLFTVKTAYKLAVNKFSRIHDNRPTPSVDCQEWKRLWRIDVIPRVKMFLWRACQNALPTLSNMARRGSQKDPICPLCGESEENISHLLLDCPPVRATWYSSALRIDMAREKDVSFRDLLWNKIINFPDAYVELFSYIAWEVWKNRNKVCMEGGQYHVLEVIRRAQSQWQENVENRGRKECTIPEKRKEEQWRKPKPGCYKLNCDVAVLGEERIGMGYVVRGDIGAVQLAGKEEMRASGSSTLLESLAMRFSIQKAKNYGLRIHTIESDSKNLIEALNGNQKPVGYCDVILQDISNLAHEVGCEEFKFIPRQGNQSAHHAARGEDFISIRSPPRHLLQYLAADDRE